MRILLIEDDATDADLMRQGLARDLGAEVGWVETLRLAGRHLIEEAEGVDAVVMDLGLVDNAGAEGVAALVEMTDAPIVVWTGESRREERMACIAAGASWVCRKPCSVSDVAEAVEVAIVAATRERGRGRDDAETSLVRRLEEALEPVRVAVGGMRVAAV